MPARADFHNHSTASDGILSPTQLVDLAAKNGVRVFALTDHDSTQGIAEASAALAKHPGMFLIPGVELSTDIENAEVHVLGYFSYETLKNAELQAELQRFRDGRFERGRQMVERLAAIGVNISWDRVMEIAGEASVGRPHVAQALVEAGHVAVVKEAFDRYIGRDGPAYVEREKMTPRQAVETLARFGAPPVLAHPTYVYGSSAALSDLDPLIDDLKAGGLTGMEVYYKHYDEATVAGLAEVAKRHGIMPLGGSDYHGIHGNEEREPGIIPLPDAIAKDFLEKKLPWVPTAELG